MNSGRRTYKAYKNTGQMAGLAAAALMFLGLALGVSRLVVIWCPRGADCSSTAQMLFWTGLFVSAAIAVGAGLAARDLVDRWNEPRAS